MHLSTEANPSLTPQTACPICGRTRFVGRLDSWRSPCNNTAGPWSHRALGSDDWAGGEGVIVREGKQVRLGERGNPCTIQDLYLEECLLGVTLAETSTSVESLRERLEYELPQGSPETRRLYAMRICKWLYPNGCLDSAPLAAWRAYHDEQILLDHFRVRYLEAVPILGKFVCGPLAAVEDGASFTVDSVRAFVVAQCGQAVPKTVRRISTNLNKLGFLRRLGSGLVKTAVNYDPTSVVLELHRVFAPRPTTVAFAELVSHPFWRYVGVPEAGALERILYAAVGHGLLAKFVKSDELNQITTGLSYGELLAKQMRLPHRQDLLLELR